MSGKTGKTHASTKKLEPGEDTIDRSTPVRLPDGTWRMQWTILLHDGRKKRPISTGPTHGQMLRNARAKAAELRKANTAGSWKENSQLSEYIEQETKSILAKAPIKERSRDSYDRALKLILGDCDQHVHKHSVRGHTISSGIRFLVLEELLTEIATSHGWTTARWCRTILNKYLITRLLREELVTGNPIKSISLETLTGQQKPGRTRGGRALTLDQYNMVLAYLLKLDPADSTDAQGHRLRPSSVAKRRNAVDQTLLQMATGLRVFEANEITWEHVSVDDKGRMSINVTKEIAKGSIPRVVLVLDRRVAERMLERKDRAKSKGYVIGTPTNSSKAWDHRSRDKATAALYQELAEKLGIDVLKNERSHLWRTTLRNHHEGKVPPAVLNSQFGHSQGTAQKHYTDVSDLSSLAEAAGL